MFIGSNIVNWPECADWGSGNYIANRTKLHFLHNDVPGTPE
jgi:hypothetical protein